MAKLSPTALRQVLTGLEPIRDPRILVGPELSDDAAVIRLSADLALVQTVDFITPLVDDPYVFGAIAAANSLSDVYAMGGTPVMALNVVCFPEGKLPLELLSQVLRGGAAKAAEGGCVVAGGHTVTDAELKYGLAVTGTIHPDQIVRNGGCRPDDLLVLTKPLGTGILATALKKGKLPQPEIAALQESMTALNDRAGAALARYGARAATDVTGFGLLGHAMEMAVASAARLEIEAARLPLLPAALAMAGRGFLTSGERRNREYLGDRLRLAVGLAGPLVSVALDPQTSGGLLVALPPESADGFLGAVPGAVRIGRVAPGPALVELG